MTTITRTLLALSALSALALSVAAQDDMEPSKTLVSPERVHDFGTIREADGPVSHTFTVINKSRKAAVIDDVSAWCGCTTVSYPKRPIAARAKAKVTVTFNPRYRPGRFSKEVVMISACGKEYTRVWVKGDVIPCEHPVTDEHPYAFGQGLYMNYKVLAFPPLQRGQSHEFVVHIANDTNAPMTVSFGRNPDNRILKMPGTLRLKAKERRTFTVRYKAFRPRPQRGYILVTPTVNGHAVKPLRVTWEKTE